MHVDRRERRRLGLDRRLAVGTKATIVRLAEHDGDLLHWFYAQGLEPGRELEVRSTEPFAVQLNGGELALTDKAAEGLFVRPA